MAFKFKKFELPDSGEFSDVDRKGMELLGKHINDQLEMLAEGIKSEEEIVESVKSSLGKLGVSAEKIEEIEKALKEQGSEIRRSMSGSAGKGRTIREQIKAFLSSDEAKRAFAEKRNTALELEIKAAATTITVAANTAAVAALNTEVRAERRHARRRTVVQGLDQLAQYHVGGSQARQRRSCIHRRGGLEARYGLVVCP